MTPSLIDGEQADGAYGLTILLTAASSDGANLLQAIFENLALAEPETVVTLESEPGVTLGASVWGIRLVRSASPNAKRLSRAANGGFVWAGDRDEWETTAMLVEPLTHQSGHQYLTLEGVDDALIEFSQGESFA